MYTSDKGINNNDVLKHFDNIADCYDRYKEVNSYYYKQLKKTYNGFIPDSHFLSIIELGCGSGELINYLNPKIGVGVDISSKMVDIASKKFCQKKNFQFHVGSIDNLDFMETLFKDKKYDYCIIPDTIEHLSDLYKVFYVLSQVIDERTKIIITWANPIWRPILELSEHLKLKMPEGPHYWPGMQEIIPILQKNNFKVLINGRNMLLPFKIPHISDFINTFASSIPLINRLCFIQYIVAGK